jgi:predicted flap endonuclease-1-like 5' DNA nuclease
MLYVLTLGWPWFAAAGALGLCVGFATATSGRNGQFSGGWVIVAALVALAGAGAAAYLGIAPGRQGLLLEVGLCAALAYFFGLPVGGGARGLLPAAAPSPVKPKPAPVARKTEPAATPRIAAPPVAPAPTPVIPAPTPVPAPASPPAPESRKKAAPAGRGAGGKPAPEHRHSSGQRPESLPAARAGGPDDLTKIKGIGPKSVEKLHALGVFHFDQIAAWNVENARWVGAALAIPGRVERNKWIQQAREIVAHAAQGKEIAP